MTTVIVISCARRILTPYLPQRRSARHRHRDGRQRRGAEVRGSGDDSGGRRLPYEPRPPEGGGPSHHSGGEALGTVCNASGLRSLELQ